MTQVVPRRVDMTALVPPPATLTSSRHTSPVQSPSSPTGSRLNLSKERQESRQRTQERSLQDKERRAQQQLERCAEERGRKMEQQRRKEQQRRAAAQEKRRQQQDAEKERLEALVRRRAGGAERRGGGGCGGVEAREQLDNRPKRWTWGGPPDGAEGNPQTPPCHAIGSAQPNELPAASSASQSRNGTDLMTVCHAHPASSAAACMHAPPLCRQHSKK
ncbi:MAP7 domain-containing protein 2-like [Poecilia latipinna]|uniref:MAP7 domain-containing protein 2-like n=1 Tax=Poecilia latipinna TaxID=48699 RepID=UPI00072E383A|nr:PREDICTED: MAP7 domain-containing protein 2-like [Poecilia latipinna]